MRPLERAREPLRHLSWPDGQRDEHGCVRRTTKERGKEFDGCGVGPVDVVEHEHERLGRRQSFEQLAHRARGAVALVRKHRAGCSGKSRERRKDRGELGTDVIVERVEAMRLESLDVFVERIDEYPERQVPLELRRGSQSTRCPSASARAASSARRRVLPIPGFAPHLERRRLTLVELGESVIDREELLGAPNEVLGKQSHVSSCRG